MSITAVCFLFLCGLAQLETLYIVKISSSVCMEDLWVVFTAEWTKITSTITENQSHFEKSEMSSAPWTLKSRKLKDNRTTRRGLHFAVVADKLDLY